MTIKRLKAWLLIESARADSDAAESHRVASDSYGAAYDLGFRDALERVRLFLKDELDT